MIISRSEAFRSVAVAAARSQWRCVAIAALAGAFLSATSLCAVAAEPVAYSLDPVHTRVMFTIDHAGFSKAIGTVSGSSGTLLFDPGDWTSARLEVRVPLLRLDLGDAKWNAAALAGNLLDGERHPEAHFISKAVEPIAPGRARVCGDLALRGVVRPLCMEVTLNALKRYPLPPFRRTAGFSATANLSRSDFGIDAWSSLIGDQVEFRIEAEAVRDRSAVIEPPDAPAAPADEAVEPAPPGTEDFIPPDPAMQP